MRILQGDETVDTRKVETGMEGIADIEIVKGVEEGETVIILIK